jgi:hypothetical protein
MSEVRDRAMAIAMLVEAFGVKDFTPARTLAYSDGLKDVPVPLLNAAVRRSIETRSWFPKVAELREDAEAARKAIVAAHPWFPCASCENHSGWVELTADGITRLTRCGCVRAHRAKLDGLGVTKEPLSLPPARDFSQVGED